MMNLIESLHELELQVFEACTDGTITEHERNMLIDEIKSKEESHKAYLESARNTIAEIKNALAK